MEFGMLIQDAMERVKGIEYETFSTSLKLPESIVKEEESSFKRDGIIGKAATKTEMGRQIREELAKKSGKEMDLGGDVTFMFDLEKNSVSVAINPVFLLCKYRKLKRGISQTRWDKYDNSVEGFIVKAAEELYNSTNAFLHGAGREDVDVRMLGDGRICTVEIVEPKKRDVDAREYEKKVKELSGGDVELVVIGQVPREYVWIAKEAHFEKEYEAEVEFEKELSEEELKKILGIGELLQQTPVRVQHRRADLVRKRNVLGIELLEKNGKGARFRIKTQAGTYIKELINGDEGRTKPSFAEIAGCKARCITLDVIKVHEYISDWW